MKPNRPPLPSPPEAPRVGLVVKAVVSTTDHVDLLNTEAWRLRRSEPVRASTLSHDAYQAASRYGYKHGIANALLTTTFCAIDAATYDQAGAYLTEAKQLFEELGDVDGQAKVAVLTGTIECRYGHYNAALTSIFVALEQVRGREVLELEAQALIRAGEAYGYQGDLELSFAYLQRGLALAEQLDDVHETSEALLLLSRTQRLRGDYQAALVHGLRALSLKRSLGDELGEAYALNSLGLVHHDPLESTQALSYYLQGLSISERLGNRRSTLALLGNLGELYGDMGELKKALTYTYKSLALSEAIGSQHTAAISLEGIGILYSRMSEQANALAYFRRALELREHIADKQGQASTLHQLGNLYASAGQYQRAHEHLQKSLELAREIKHPYTEAQVLTSFGRVHSQQGEQDEAERCFVDALALAQQLKLPGLVRDSSEALYRLYKRASKTDQALAQLELLYVTDQALTDETAARRTQRLLVQFESERLQQEAEIQRLRNVELAEVNIALNATIAQNARLLERLREQTERLQRQADEDGLTELYNRRYAERQLTREFERTRRHGRSLSVALLDIDNFKGINDRFSHALGDDVLKAVATILSASVRATDMVARYGGEEFVLLLPETSVSEGLVVCEKLREAIDVYAWQELRPELHVTVSIGLCGDLTLASYEQLLAHADSKLYQAKREGKNRVR